MESTALNQSPMMDDTFDPLVYAVKGASRLVGFLGQELNPQKNLV